MRYYRSYFFLPLLLVVMTASAQVDSHYWTHQYGAKGLLLNGAVIASADGETSLFYNPGSMGMDDNLGFAFSFLSPTYSNLSTTNFLGDDNRISDTGLGFSPGFLGIRFKPFKTDKIVAGITAFERFKTNIRFRDRVVDEVNDGNLFLFRGDLDFSRRISEDWYGIGLAYKISDNVGIGLTHFSIWHSQRLNFNLKKELVPRSNPSDVFLGWHREFGYNLSVSPGFVTKLGFCMRQPGFNLGMTFTTPTYGIVTKSAEYYTDDFRINAPQNSSTNVSNRDRVDLRTLRSPYSLGIGLDIMGGRDVLSVSAEYFGGVDRYTIFSAVDDSVDGLGSDTLNTSIILQNEEQSVFNIAIGLTHKHSDKLTYVCGVRTDFDQNTNLTLNNSNEYLGTIGDVYHVSGGGMFTFGKNKFSIGADLAYGRKSDGRQIVDVRDIDIDNFYLLTGKDNVSTRFYSVMVFLTYDFIFSRINSQ